MHRLSAEEKSTGGIIIPDNAPNKPVVGEVVAIGLGARKSKASMPPSR